METLGGGVQEVKDLLLVDLQERTPTEELLFAAMLAWREVKNIDVIETSSQKKRKKLNLSYDATNPLSTHGILH